ncbi:amino acid permease (plasmid) [Halococcus dombrowskii]|uniref:Amino acid permease n=1 Tax=Halococcus dombrowskii TaxID=179637 RepID=A0AAV3SHQ4_HALDO|nr:amino acid permease [Halococcus dombrowskii]UOO97285.1 amino acid permease [Halococcus dombrowskii]
MTDPTQETNSTGDGSGTVETELSRDMSLTDITMIGVGAMIGAGVFALTGFAAGIAGPAITLAFVLNGIVALFIAISYAELGAAFPEAGGGYLWVKEALVDPNGFYAGWMSWFAHAVACALYAVTFGVFLTEFFVVFSDLGREFVFFGFITRRVTEKAVAVVVIAAFAYINYRGAEETGSAELVVVAIKLVILGLFILFGALATFSNPNWPATFLSQPSFAPAGVAGIIGAMGFTFIAFEGYEIIVQSGEEVVNPGENVPKAVFYSLIIVVPVYVLVAFALIGGLNITPEILEIAGISRPPDQVFVWQVLQNLGELGLIRAAEQFLPYGALLLIVAGLASTTSALNATVYSSSRVSFAMGRDRVLPGMFNNIHPEKKTPHVAIIVSMVLIMAMAVTLPIESVAAAADIMFILLFLQVNWTVIKMRSTHPDLPRTFEIPYMPWPPIIGIVLLLILLPFIIYELGLEAIGIGTSNEGLIALGVTTIWMALGLVIYYGYSAEKEDEKLEEETPTLTTEQTPADRDSQLVVPVANPESAEPLMLSAIDIARDMDAEIHVVSVVTVPQQTPLDEGREFVGDERETLKEAMSIAEGADVPVRGTIRIGHDVAPAILNTVEQHDSDAILMGWRGRGRRTDFVLGSNVDQVVTQAKCDVLVERISSVEDVDSILLPTAGGPHAEYAAEIARAIARPQDARINVVYVIDPEADEDERENARERLESTTDVIDDYDRVESSLLEGTDIAERIIEESDNHDHTVIGATREGLLQQIVFGGIPEEVGRRAKHTVIMAKHHQGITSRLTRWFKSQQQ